MDYTRILCCQDFILGEYLILTKGDSKHLSQVLRKKEGSLIQLFDGKGSSCIAEITSQEKKILKVQVVSEKIFKERQGIDIFLGQSLIKSEPFSFSVQKATELGVVSISPLNTERTVVKLNNDFKKSRKNRWEAIAKSACQQCGEDWLPEINEIQDLKNWSQVIKAKHKVVLYPSATSKLSGLSLDKSVAIAIGPEGDFTENEINFLEKIGFLPVSLGPRVLRAETAVISSLSAIRTMCREF